MENELVIPKHIAIILDGNGRYAKAHNLPRKLGHKAGCETLEQIVEDCARLGVEYFTVYAFSTENWKRSEEEISALMSLFRFYLKKLVGVAMENNVKVVSIGDTSKFDEDIREGLESTINTTSNNTGMVFAIAINYGSRDEIRRAVTEIAQDVKDGKFGPEDITEQMINDHLDTADMPDPDLLIRTAGEQRLSNFLLWQSAYTEFYYTDVFWPDFHKDELMKAIESFNKRERRYGGRNS